MCRPSASAVAGDRLAVRDPQRLGVDGDAEAALQPVDGDGELHVAEAAQQQLAGGGRARRASVGSSSRRRASAGPSLSSSLCVRGTQRDRGDGRRAAAAASMRDRLALRREHVAGAGVAELGDDADVAGGERVDVDVLLAPQREEPVQALVAARAAC